MKEFVRIDVSPALLSKLMVLPEGAEVYETSGVPLGVRLTLSIPQHSGLTDAQQGEYASRVVKDWILARLAADGYEMVSV
jgi:hypothetical protein